MNIAASMPVAGDHADGNGIYRVGTVDDQIEVHGKTLLSTAAGEKIRSPICWPERRE
jgi:hypothetical protein